MKILAIDDQKLVLLPLQKRLRGLGYDVKTETESNKGLLIYKQWKPDLVILDISMPKISGIELIKHIRITHQDNVPIVILSGKKDDNTIKDAFELGINDYMKKPLSLNEICLRIKNIIGLPEKKSTLENTDSIIIQERCVGVVIPCYDEENRLLSKEFTDFIDKNSGYHLCFVNDGSKDNTLDVLKNLKKGREDFISIYNCVKNGGKAEAVRLGMLHMAKMDDLDYIGFLDADLSTDLADFDDLVSTIQNSKYKIVSGSRMSRMGADISKESARKLISLTINFIIRKILAMNFNDTQCGAKIFHKDIIQIAFSEKFITKWLFDVEIFLRVRKHFKLPKTLEIICEKPLKRWIHMDGSKLTMNDSMKIIFQLGKIAWTYTFRKKSAKSKICFTLNNNFLQKLNTNQYI
jgi:CheY-like chemotaxis protein